MQHRKILQVTIIVVVAILIVWSIVNVAAYAYIYHANYIVATLGIAVGAANALSVYAYVVARTGKVKWPAGVGIALFGGASGLLQMLLYRHDAAPWAAAIAFGWIGPVAEAVLSWLHAALSEEESAIVQLPTVQPAKRAQRKPEVQSTPEIAPEVQSESATPALSSHVLQAYAMQQNGMAIPEIAVQLQKSKRTISNYIAQAKALHNGHGTKEPTP